MSMMVSFVLSFFPRDVLDEILNLIGSVSEGFPSYSSMHIRNSTSVTYEFYCFTLAKLVTRVLFYDFKTSKYVT